MINKKIFIYSELGCIFFNKVTKNVTKVFFMSLFKRQIMVILTKLLISFLAFKSLIKKS